MVLLLNSNKKNYIQPFSKVTSSFDSSLYEILKQFDQYLSLSTFFNKTNFFQYNRSLQMKSQYKVHIFFHGLYSSDTMSF